MEPLASHQAFPGQTERVLWSHSPPTNARAQILIVHGMAEHSGRYQECADHWANMGIKIWRYDHRGHGPQVAPCHRGLIDQWQDLVDDLAILVRHLTEQRPDLPLYLYAHSMGSFVVQSYLTDARHLPADNFAGVIFSGSNWGQQLNYRALGGLASYLCWRQGPDYFSPLIDKLVIGRFNLPFQPAKTASDWLSRDKERVQGYIADPYSGHLMSNRYWQQFCAAMINLKKQQQQIQRYHQQRFLLIAGRRDSVGGKAGNRRLYRWLEKNGINQVNGILYRDARHELINEVNRQQVIKDVGQWIMTP